MKRLCVARHTRGRVREGTVGDALDSTMAESFFATLQTELLDQRPWPTRAALTTAIFDYIEGFYNRRRRHSALAYLSPDEYEMRRHEDSTHERLAA